MAIKKKRSGKDVSDTEITIAHAAPLKSKNTKDSTTKTVKKKKKKRTVEGAQKKIARTKDKISQELAEIEQMPVNPGEKEYVAEYLLMFSKLQRIARKMEKQCLEKPNPRDLYALSTLYSQQREVIADIRAVTDLSGQVEMLIDGVLQPMVKSVGQNLLDSYYQMRKLISEIAKPEEKKFALGKLDELVKDQGMFLQQSYASSVEHISTILLGDKKK